VAQRLPALPEHSNGEAIKIMEAAQENNGKHTRLSFSLTRLQRTLNPLERLIFAILGTVVLAFGVWAVVSASGLQRLLIIVIVVLPLLVFRKPMLSFYRGLVGHKYINTVEIKNDTVAFGVNEPQAKISRQPLKVSKGLCGTFVIRHPYGYSLVIPNDVVSFERLTELIKHGC
jgi:ABC-type multidrug transport system fused ATPase/permease subunit